MRNSSNKICGMTFTLAVSVALAGMTVSAAQKVPVSFNDYHGFTETAEYLNRVADAYPDITKLIEIGQSTMGRPIYVLVISNMKTGTTIDAHVKLRNMRAEGVKNVTPGEPYQGKPGHWICGSMHGNEQTGTEVCLYIIDKLVSGHGSDQEITRLVDNKTFYVCPIVNPDGLYNSIERGMSQRQNSMNLDDDGDGRVNEDGPDDLDGNSVITQFRYPDPEGRYLIDDEDPRLMVRMKKNQKTKDQRYSVVREDKDNDGDGKRGEDSECGIDLNRNFPEGWFKPDSIPGGSGDYPTSAPESRALAEFFTNHTNVLMAQYYHTSGGFTYRPLGTAPHPNLHAKDVAVLDRIMGKKYLEITGGEVPEAWKTKGPLTKFKEELKKTSKNKYAIQRGYELPRGWRVSYGEAEDRRYGYGMATDWMYLQHGVYSITTELWNPEENIKDFPKCEGADAGIERARALLKYQDEHYGGKLFVEWKAFTHPDLGEGEIGGWIPKYRSNALPGDPLLDVCEKHWQFELFRAGLLPEVVITRAKARVLYTTNNASAASAVMKGDQVRISEGKPKGQFKIVEVTATIQNQGQLATHVARGAQLAGNREDVVWLIGDRDKVTFLQGTAFQKLGVLEGVRRQAIEPTEGKQKGPKRDVKWLVAVEGNTPLKIVVTSQKGGTKVKELDIQ